jgi:HAD superfamily hydrolase (TIGR01509 family)
LGVVQKIGVNASDNWELLCSEYGLKADIEELVRRKREVYTELLANQINAMPGLHSLIVLLDKESIKRAVASSSSQKHIGMVVEGLGVPSFHALASGEEVERGKPHPDIFLRAASLLGVEPKDCVVFEDAESGVVGAHKAGMRVVAVPNRFTDNHDFSKADRVIPSLEAVTLELLTALRK